MFLMPRIGPIQLATPFCQAGLAGYSDRAMRLVARRRGCPYAVTEALLDTIMLNGGEGLRKSIDINDEDHPVAGQIIGAEPDAMARAAKILANAGYDVIDLNFACPVKKIKNKARGGHMLRDVSRAISILKSVRDALPPNVPTTVSLRRGFDDSSESVDLFHEITETAWSLGYSALRVHSRTVEQKYLGQSRWEFLRKFKADHPEKIILGSGDRRRRSRHIDREWPFRPRRMRALCALWRKVESVCAEIEGLRDALMKGASRSAWQAFFTQVPRAMPSTARCGTSRRNAAAMRSAAMLALPRLARADDGRHHLIRRCASHGGVGKELAGRPLIKVKVGGEDDAERIRAVAQAPPQAGSSSTPTKAGPMRTSSKTCWPAPRPASC